MFTIKQGKSQTVQASVDVEGNFSRLQHWRVPDDVQIMIRKKNRRVISKLELNEEENKEHLCNAAADRINGDNWGNCACLIKLRILNREASFAPQVVKAPCQGRCFLASRPPAIARPHGSQL